MRKKVNRTQLLQALELVSPGLSTRDVMEQGNSFCFQNKRVFTYDDEVACIMPSPLDITGAVPAEPLKAILSKLKEETLDVVQENGEITFKGKGHRTGIRFDPKIELPIENLETPKEWKPLPDQFSEGLRLVTNCASKDDSQFELSCIHLHPKWIEAYDTYQFARFTLDMGIKKEMLVRHVSIRHIIDLEMREFSETPQWMHFRNSTGLIMACRRFMDAYPDLTVISEVNGKKIQLPKGLADVAERAEIFSIKDPQENHVLVELKPQWVVVRGEGNYGYHRGSKKINYNGDILSFMVHPQMLAQLVKKHSECQICVGKIKALRAELGNLVFVTSLSDPKEEGKNEVKKTAKDKKIRHQKARSK